MDLHLDNKVAIVTGSSRGLGLASARALAEEGAASCCARAARRRSTRRPPRSSRAAAPAAVVLTVEADVVDARRRRARRRAALDDVRPHRHPRQQRRQGRRRRHRRRRSTPSGRARSIRRCFRRSACRASSCRTCASAGGGVDSDDRVDLGPRVRRPHDLQRREGRRDQPGEGDGAAAGAATTSASTASRPARSSFEGGSWWKRQQDDPAGIADFVRRELPFGRFGTRRGSRRRRRVSRLAARELDHRRVRHRRRRSVAGRTSDATRSPTAIDIARRRCSFMTRRRCGVLLGVGPVPDAAARRRPAPPASARRCARCVAAAVDGRDGGVLSPFQAFMTALGASIGTGNIAGVATAIISGGPGALFWIWVYGFVATAIKFSEAVLGVRFRADAGRPRSSPARCTTCATG